MKKYISILLIILSLPLMAGNEVWVIRDKEVKLAKTTSTQTYTYKGAQLFSYNINPDKTINVYFVGSSQVLTIDTTKIYSYNDAVGTVSTDTIMSHLRLISTK
jgi:hypothetical protein